MVNAVKNTMQAFTPKSLGNQMLKMKIYMQTLIGSTFGIKFRGLEESKQRFHQTEQ